MELYETEIKSAIRYWEIKAERGVKYADLATVENVARTFRISDLIEVLRTRPELLIEVDSYGTIKLAKLSEHPTAKKLGLLGFYKKAVRTYRVDAVDAYSFEDAVALEWKGVVIGDETDLADVRDENGDYHEVKYIRGRQAKRCRAGMVKLPD